MTAAVYSREITESGNYECKRCAAFPAEWERLGRCTGAIVGGVELLPIKIPDGKNPGGEPKTSPDPYPVEFDVCPMGLLRRDLRPRETAVADIVSQAAYAKVGRRWPNVPARLWTLLMTLECAQADKMEAFQNACMKGA